MKKILIFAFILLNLTGCTNTDVRDNSLVIAKIGIDEKYSIVNLDDDVNGIVMYSEEWSVIHLLAQGLSEE